jgi:hypothetical protein
MSIFAWVPPRLPGGGLVAIDATMQGQGTLIAPIGVVLGPAPPSPDLLVFQERGPELSRLELWTDIEAAGGQRIAPILHWLELSETEALEGEHSISFTVPMDHPVVRLRTHWTGLDNLRVNQVVRMLKGDGSFTEHRISESSRINKHGQRTRQIVARSIFQDLGLRGIVSKTYADGTSTTSFEILGLTVKKHIEQFIIPALEQGGQDFWTVGDIAHEAPVNVNYDSDSPLAALRKIARAAGNLEPWVEGSAVEYKIHMPEFVGFEHSPLRVRARRNLIDLTFRESGDDQATRVLAFGSSPGERRPTLGQAEWNVTGIITVTNGYQILLRDPVTGRSPIQYNTQFTRDDLSNSERCWLEWTAGFYTYYKAPIRATFANSGIVEIETNQGMPPLWGFSADRPDIPARARIVADGSGKHNLHVDNPTMRAIYGVRVGSLDRSDIPGTHNLVPNAICSKWADGQALPQGWYSYAPVGTPQPVISRELNPRYWEHGGQAMRVRFPAGTDPDAYIATPQNVFPLKDEGMISYFVRLTPILGKVRTVIYLARRHVDLNNNPTSNFVFPGKGDSNTYLFPDQTGWMDVDEDIIPDIVNRGTGIPEDLGHDAIWDLSRNPLYGGTFELRIYPERNATGTMEFVVSGAQITISDRNLPLLDGNGGIYLHLAAQDRIAQFGSPAPALSANLMDLAMVRGMRYPYTPIKIGAQIIMDDPDSYLENASSRIVGITRNHRSKLIPDVQLANQRLDLARALAGQRVTERYPTALTPRGLRGNSYGPT